METFEELLKWMKSECYNDASWSIWPENKPIFEGRVVKKNGEKFTVVYTERGQEEILRNFNSEIEAVTYVHHALMGDKWSRSHVVLFSKIKEDADQLCAKLTQRDIEFEYTAIPYSKGEIRHRVIVFGCDVNKVNSLT